MSFPVIEYILTRAQLEQVRTDLAKQNIPLKGDSGDISSKGVQLAFEYVEPKLTITVVDHGMLPMFILKSKMNGWFKTEVIA